MLGLLEFFWNVGGVPTPTPAPTSGPSSGGSGNKGHKHKNDYTPLPDEYWAERAKRLTPTPKEGEPTLADKKLQFLQDLRQIAVEQDQLANIQQTYQQALAALRSASSVDEMKAISGHITQLQETGKTVTAQHKARMIRAKSLHFEILGNQE